MLDLEIISRYPDGTLRPAQNVNRLEFIAMLFKFMYGGAPVNEGFAAMNPFADVPEWGAAYVGWAYSGGIIADTGDNKFGPYEDVKLIHALSYIIWVFNPEFELGWEDDYPAGILTIAHLLGLLPSDFTVPDQNALTRADAACLFNFAIEAYNFSS